MAGTEQSREIEAVSAKLSLRRMQRLRIIRIAIAAVLFQLFIFFMVNEAWYWLCAWPGVFLALFQGWRNRNVREEDRADHVRGVNALVRVTGIVILVLPHFIYGALWVLNSLPRGALERWGNLNFDSSLFLSSYASCAVLFILAMIFFVQPYSFSHLMMKWFEPALEGEKVTADESVSDVPPSFVLREVPAGMPGSHSLLFDVHYRQVMERMETNEEILMATAPVPYAFNRQTRMECMMGVPFLLAAMWVASMLFSVMSLSESTLLFVGLLAMMAVFFTAGCLLAFSPARWRKRLSRTDYFITSRRVFLADGKDLLQFFWKDASSISLNMNYGPEGSIYISSGNRVTAWLGKWFGEGTVNAYETDETGRMNGLLNIPQAAGVYEMMESLIETSKEGKGAA